MGRLGLLFTALLLTTGCDKLKAMAHKGDDGGTTSSSGGGLLGSLFDSTFEGEITADVVGKGDKAPKQLTVGIKSPKLRADVGAFASGKDDPFLSQGASFILDPPSKKAYLLVPAKKMAVVIDFDKMKQQRGTHPTGPHGAGGSPGKAEDPPKLEKTGKTEIIAGYKCEDWKITSKDGSHADLCMAEGIKLMDFTDLASQSPQLAAAAALGDLNHFPLKAVSFDTANVEQGRLEVKKIDKKKLPDADFTVPADYQQMDMAQMMAAMLGGAGGRPGMPGMPGMPPGMPGRPGMPPPHGRPGKP